MRAPDETGMTLVEVMVALAIIAVMSGVAVLGLNGATRGATAEAEARRLASRLRLAADEAMVTGSGLGLQWDARGYSFVRWDPAVRRWSLPKVDALDAPHKLPAVMSLLGEKAWWRPGGKAEVNADVAADETAG